MPLHPHPFPDTIDWMTYSSSQMICMASSTTFHPLVGTLSPLLNKNDIFIAYSALSRWYLRAPKDGRSRHSWSLLPLLWWKHTLLVKSCHRLSIFIGTMCMLAISTVAVLFGIGEYCRDAYNGGYFFTIEESYAYLSIQNKLL